MILALLGEDKEGKSTLLKAASGGEKPETGDIYIDGISIYEKGENAYCNFGYMSKEYGFYSLLKVEEYYELFLALYKVGGRYRSRRIEEVLELLDMKEYEEHSSVNCRQKPYRFYIWERPFYRNQNGC